MNKRLSVLISSIIAVGCIALLVGSGAVLADNGLHDQESLTEADVCAGCHRAHTAKSLKLLSAESEPQLFCFVCHDGSGAETDVVNGELVGDSYGTMGAGLRGGGFSKAKMDIDHDGVIESGNVTSTHAADGVTQGMMWGSGSINSEEDYGVLTALACEDCHNPHGNGNYRILRGRPSVMEERETASPVDVPDEVGAITYEITYTPSNYRDLSYVPAELDEWCAQCHTRYNAPANSGHQDSGDMVFAYRHATETIGGGCLACHVSHGTSAAMGTYSSAMLYPDPNQGAEGSALLALNNRAVCLAQCHSAATLSED
ncbi:MAG: cytochrome c3 family protein [Chloroflexota bacterium]|nr:cytochrome c3 family protein [Chloroflexota bacterium]